MTGEEGSGEGKNESRNPSPPMPDPSRVEYSSVEDAQPESEEKRSHRFRRSAGRLMDNEVMGRI